MSSALKIVPLEGVRHLFQDLRKEGKKIVHCHGVFDLLHPGHIKYFEAAKKQGDVLVVTLTSDRYVNKGPDRPAFQERIRLETIAALECVDFVALNDHPTAVEIIELIKPHFYVKGSEYENAKKDVTGAITREQEAVEKNGGVIFFTHEPTYSSSGLLNRYFDVTPQDTRLFLQEFQLKHSTNDVLEAIASLKDMRVLVIGETIIDEYAYVRALGKTAKDSIIAQHYLNEEAFAGGVIACANHAAGFCKEVHIVSCLGAGDSREEFVRSKLKPNVSAKFFNNEQTIVKRRYLDANFLTKLFELYCFTRKPPSEELGKEVIAYLEPLIQEYDAVIALDYGHGFMTTSMIEFLGKRANYLAVNTQTNAGNTGYNLITKYPRADFICIDEPEARLAISDQFADAKDLIERIHERIPAKRIIITQGHKGNLAYDEQTGFMTTPVLSTNR